MNVKHARHFALAISLSLASLIAAAQQPATPGPQEKPTATVLDRAQLDALLAKPEQILLIDVRRPDELTNIGGFPVYLSIQSKELEKSLAYIPKDRLLVTISNHSGRAKGAAALLTAKGYKVAGAVGVQDYEAQGGTLTKIAPPPPKPDAAGTGGEKK